MDTIESLNRRKRTHFGAVVFLSTLLSACGPQLSEPTPSETSTASASENASRARVPGSVAELQGRYEAAAVAEDAYIECMERYFPNYRQYGGVFRGDPLDGTPHPSEEGCRAERDARNQLAVEIGLPQI